MTDNFFALYDTIIDALPGDGVIETVLSGERWALAESLTGSALAMMTEGDSIAPMFPRGLTGMDIKTAAQAIKSWNFEEAGLSIAAVTTVPHVSARTIAGVSSPPWLSAGRSTICHSWRNSAAI